MPIIKCKFCGTEVLALHSVNAPNVRLMVEIEAAPTGTVAINELLGTFAVIPRPGKIAKRRDLHKFHAINCPGLVNKKGSRRRDDGKDSTGA